jgi:glycosyltransferase involved in cell wall biosynthesis
MANSPHATPRGDCILFATADWDEPYWTNKQHTARALVKLGWRVLYIESVGMRSPRANSSRDWKRLYIRLRKGLVNLFAGAKEREPNLWVLSPLAVPAAHNRPWVGKLNRLLLRTGIQRHIARHKFITPLIWTYHPFIFQAIDGLKRGPLLYHCVDDLSTVPGVDAPSFKQAEDYLLTQCDNVYATTQTLTDRCLQINPTTVFLPNVVDVEHFCQALGNGEIPEDLACIPEPRLVYHGVLSDFKMDFDLIYEAACLRPKWHWIFIGGEREGQRSDKIIRLKNLPNVHFLGYKPYTILPDYLRGMQVGLLPSLLNEYTRSMFPMKYFEYLSAGLPVVSTSLDFIRSYRAGLLAADDAEAFITAIGQQLERGRFSLDEALCMVADNTWQSRTKTMLQNLNSECCNE